MSFNHAKAGPNSVPAYQIPGVPYVTSSVENEVKGVDSDSASLDPVALHFPFVTNFVTIRNTGKNPLRVGFSVRGIFAPGEHQPASLGGAQKVSTNSQADNRNYFIIPTGSGGADAVNSVQTFDIRCKSIFFMSDAAATSSPGDAQATDFSLIAGLTLIHSDQFPTLTGSVAGTGSFEGVG